ncbi:glycosyltransferase family 39 protein [candidate division WOR-3 bacterium]|nr:glycosyltransferase family 39 protein [candidate division WOR-3 bacterium]
MRSHRLNLGETLRRNRWLFLLLALSLAIHFLLLIPALKDSSRLFVWPDSVCYERLALNMLQGNGYSLAQASPYEPNSTMVPGYPLFIAGIYAVFGQSPYAVVIIQAILSLALIAGLMWCGIRQFSKKAGIIAGILLLLNLCLAFYSTQIMTDILFLVFLLPGLWLVLRLFEGRRPVYSGLGAGLLLGLGALTRPIGLYFPLILAFLFFIKPFGKPGRSRLFGYGALLLVCIAVVSPWFIRNRVVFGHFFFSTVQSFNLSHIHAAPIKASIEGKTVYEAEADLERAAFARYGEPCNEAEGFIFTGREAVRYILKHPGRYTVLYAAGVAKTLLPLGFAEFLLFYASPEQGIRNLTPPVQKAILKGDVGEALRVIWQERIAPTGWVFVVYVLGLLFNIFIIVLAIKGFVKKSFKVSFNLLAFLTALYFLGVTGPAGQPRHFLPLLPLAALLAAHGLASGNLKKTNTLRRL